LKRYKGEPQAFCLVSASSSWLALAYLLSSLSCLSLRQLLLRQFRRACMTCRWAPTKPTRLTKEEKRQYYSGRHAVMAEAFALMGGRFGLIIET
jgi:hypothetical protein